MVDKKGLPVWSLVFVLGVVCLAPRFSAAQVSPGDRITRANADKVKGLVSDGVYWAVRRGMNMNIIPYERIPLPPKYQEATEKYASQVELNKDGTLSGYVAGRPFPKVDPSDPKIAMKLMYNFERTHYFTDDLALHLVDAETGSLRSDSEGHQRYDVERYFVADWLRILQFIGRLHIPPIPTIEPNRDETFRKAGLFPLIEPFDLKGVGGISYRYLDRARQDDTWLYLPFLRRVRRMSSAQRSDALFGQDIDVDSYGGYAGQIPWFKWRFLGERPMLASLHGKNLPPVPCTEDGGMTFCEDWEMRPSVYIIEGTPTARGYAYSKRVIFMDKETFFISYSDLYDRGGELWKVVIQNIRTSTKPNPKVSYSYATPRMFIYGFSVVDIQLEHGTRAAIPGMAFPEEPGWYIDVGDAAGSTEEWFTIASLIRAGR